MLKTTPIYHLVTNLSLVLTLFFLLEVCFIILLMLTYCQWHFPTIRQWLLLFCLTLSSLGPRWRFNTMLLRDEAFKTKFSSQLTDFVNVNKGSVDDPRILWDAIKGFIRNFTVCYASSLRKAWSSRLQHLNSQLKMFCYNKVMMRM